MEDLGLQSSKTAKDGSLEEQADMAEALIGCLNALLADLLALHIKTKGFHWHVRGPHFHDYHLLLDEQAAALFSMTDVVAERVRKLGGTTLRSIGDIARFQRISDTDADVPSQQMLVILLEDVRSIASEMRTAHALSQEARDIATEGVLESFMDEIERIQWFLREVTVRG